MPHYYHNSYVYSPLVGLHSLWFVYSIIENGQKHASWGVIPSWMDENVCVFVIGGSPRKVKKAVGGVHTLESLRWSKGDDRHTHFVVREWDFSCAIGPWGIKKQCLMCKIHVSRREEYSHNKPRPTFSTPSRYQGHTKNTTFPIRTTDSLAGPMEKYLLVYDTSSPVLNIWFGACDRGSLFAMVRHLSCLHKLLCCEGEMTL